MEVSGRVPEICVLMSTYNGEQYLREQLDSIFSQSEVAVSLIVRDDGSSDGTISILEEYSRRHAVRIIEGSNLRPAQSFRELVVQAPLSYDYYAYADQDDIWECNKFINAVRMLERQERDVPLLWYSGIVKYIGGKEAERWCCDPDRGNSLRTITKTFSSTNGCTMVFNRELLRVLKSCESGQIDMHDSWTHAMCLACGGQVLCDPTPYVKYRIHEKQVLGNEKKSLKDAVRRFFRAKSLRSATIRTMLSSEYIEEEQKTYLKKLADYRSSISARVYLISEVFRNDHPGMSGKEKIRFVIQLLTNKF